MQEMSLDFHAIVAGFHDEGEIAQNQELISPTNPKIQEGSNDKDTGAKRYAPCEMRVLEHHDQNHLGVEFHEGGVVAIKRRSTSMKIAQRTEKTPPLPLRQS
eukprot:SAG31_NODE_439_length_15675_cov_6.578390_17_plen_102_part_00